jgi:trehalose 6-phosphate phosphatase
MPMRLPPPLDRRSSLFIDIDGTLLEIASRPELVRVPPDLPDLLTQLAGQRDGALALVSGRTLAQIDQLFAPWLGAAAGLHGGERRRADGSHVVSGESPADREAAVALARLRPTLAALAETAPGAWLEDKGGTLAVHCRAAPERFDAIRHAGEAMIGGSDSPLRMIAGKMVVEFQPRHHGKNGAIAAFMAEPPFRDRRPIFLGDDTTDEDGFAEVNRRGGLSIRVGPPGAMPSATTAAFCALPSVAAVMAWLKAACL